LKELGQLEGQEICIILKDDNYIFKQPYKLSDVEKVSIQVQTRFDGTIQG
jgi:hypothetical protein